jgi:hypothetical protein
MDPFLTRRGLLLGAAGGVLLAACGKSDGSEDDASSSTTTTGPDGAGSGEVAGGLALFKLFPAEQPVGVDLRLPLALSDSEGSFDVETPRELSVRLRRPDGGVLDPQTVSLHDQDLPRGYYPLRTSFDATGRWGVVVETGTTQVESTIDVREARELPSLAAPGDVLPKIPTPTRSAKRGVDPICTADPICPFHASSLDEVIGAGNPIVLIVSTPAFCQVAICGPVLDLLVERKATMEASGLAVIHAEVYVDESARVTSPTVDALGLTFEPSLFLAAPDGTVTDRLDSIFDGAELDEAISRLAP